MHQESSGSTTSSDNDQDVHIAIIGASYAGLTLANVLHLHSIPYTIFDSKTLPFTYITGGTGFNVPSYGFIKEKLDLKSSSTEQATGYRNAEGNASDDEHDESVYTREEVISSLLGRVKMNFISSQNILRIEKRSEEEFYLHSKRNSAGLYYQSKTKDAREESDSSTTYGPYHCVVGADGVLSKCRTSAMLGTYLIGDARWANDRFYDLGLRRIKQGSDLALMDGLALGEEMVVGLVKGKNTPEAQVLLKMSENAKRKYCARKIFYRKTNRQLVILSLLLAMFLNGFFPRY
jgi:hypothetical protein